MSPNNALKKRSRGTSVFIGSTPVNSKSLHVDTDEIVNMKFVTKE